MPVLSRLTLIGSIHLDVAAECGPLRVALEKLRPEIIAVEISPFSVFYRLKNQKRWLSLFYKNIAPLAKKERLHSGLKLLKLQIMMPFEWQVARYYGKEKGIPVLAIDSGDIAKNEMPSWENMLLSTENINNIVKSEPFDLENHFVGHYKTAQDIIARQNFIPDTIHPLRWLRDESWAKREKLLATRIRRILKTKRKTVYIGGWMHIVMGSPYKTLAERLSDLNPQCILLDRNSTK
ncbi:MAG: hypothetical protein ACUVQV_08205 [Dissulfurimicrobium sp.]|uniref:hypothetical protein n=1 Tax=Dissulfurimicrobium sp. TaxID=2022436 RepID=UPI00404980AA